MSNTYTNKVQLADGTTILDISSDTVTAADVSVGVTFHLKSGEQTTGTLANGDGLAYGSAPLVGYAMAKVLVTQSKLDTLAGIIGGKSSTEVPLTLDEMITAADSITSGGGITPTGNIDITQAGVTDVTNYATATVPSANYNTTTDNYFTTQNGQRKWHNDGYISVEDEGWLDDNISVINYNYNAVPSGTTITPTTSSQTIGGANYMMEGAVTVSAMPTGTAGTPTATKGAVSNHSVSVTPSVTNTTGYITGSTKTGTAVTVSASELDSGAKSITANGNSQDVVGYASVNVNVPNSYSASDEGKVVSSGSLVSQTSATYTSNDTYDTTLINSVTVNVSGGGTGAISVVDTTDTAGGTIREITAIDISDTTATASDVASGKYFYTAAGVKTAGTASGGGNLGGLSNMLDVNSQNYEFAYMLMAMKKGNTAGGTVTYTTGFPNTETKILETGLTTVHGFMFVQPDIDLATTESGQCNKVILVFITSSDTINAVGFSTTNAARIYGQAQGTVQQATPLNGAIRVSGGDIYYTGRYNKNASYQMLKVNQQYEWLAW